MPSMPSIPTSTTSYTTSSGLYDSHGIRQDLGDYNHLVNAFDSKSDIFNQQTYEVRIDAEADLMIALEALKNEFKYLKMDIQSLGRTLER